MFEGILSSASTLGATFVGAFLAFALENFRRKRERQDKDFAACNLALYTIFNMWNILKQYQTEHIEEYRNKPDRWLNISAHPSFEYGLVKFDAKALSFLLQTKFADLYAQLMLEEQRYMLAIKLIDERSKVILDDAYPRISSCGVKVGEQRSSDEMEAILGADTTNRLKVYTDEIIKIVDQNVRTLERLYAKLRPATKELFPKRKPITVAFVKGNAEPT